MVRVLVQVGEDVDEIDNSHAESNVKRPSESRDLPMLQDFKFFLVELFEFGCHKLFPFAVLAGSPSAGADLKYRVKTFWYTPLWPVTSPRTTTAFYREFSGEGGVGFGWL